MAKLSATKAGYRTDDTLKDQGAWMTLAGGGKLRVRSQSSRLVKEYARKQVKKNRHLYASGSAPSIEQQDEMDIDLCVDVLITGWDDFQDDDGQPEPFTKDGVRDLVTVEDLRKDVLTFAADRTNYGIEGNSSPSSKQS